MTNKCVQEFEIKFYDSYINALLQDKGRAVKIEIENNHLPQSISIENDGISQNYRMIPFKRQGDSGMYLENVYVLIS